MLELQLKRLALEQEAYRFLRNILIDEFLQDPPKFVTHFKKRPEDLDGAELRQFYQDCVHQKIGPTTADPTFNRYFAEGRIFRS